MTKKALFSTGTGKVRRAALLAVAAAAFSIAMFAPSHPAEAACPNEAIREGQGATILGDCRAWELVSTPEKNNAQLAEGALLSPDGDHAFYGMLGGLPGSPTGTYPRLLATRTASGWSSANALPPRSQMPAFTYYPAFENAGMTEWLAVIEESIGGGAISPDETLARLDFAGHQTILHHFSRSSAPTDLVASEDLSHVYIDAYEILDPSQQPGTQDVYDFGSGLPELVSRMPGSQSAPPCGVTPEAEELPGFANTLFEPSSALNWVSQDGSIVFFATRGDEPGCAGPIRLYRRDRSVEKTELISGTALPGDPALGIDDFVQAAPDGSWVLFRTATSFVAADDSDGSADDEDIYRWRAGSGDECLTCIGVSAAVRQGIDSAVASEDGSRVYFLSLAQLENAPSPGSLADPNLYEWHEGAIRWIASTTTEGVDTLLRGYLTPDGSVIIFSSADPRLDPISGKSNGALRQWYRYDDRDKSLTCLSCPSGPVSGPAPQALMQNSQQIKAPIRAASDDGDTVFFPARDALVPEDSNNTVDLYEWHDGKTSLITSGKTKFEGLMPTFFGASADGRDVLFQDPEQLTSEGSSDSSYKLYDARVEGGFPPAGLNQAPPCVESGCRQPVDASPGPLPLASDTVSSPRKPSRPRHHRHKHRRRRHRHHADWSRTKHQRKSASLRDADKEGQR